MDTRRFPEGFLWGAATAAHQVEGGNYNDWSEWEIDGHTRDMSGRACGHWDTERFIEDIAWLKLLGLNAYRMSIEWSRVMPRPGEIDAGALRKYGRMLRILKDEGFVTMVTLHHFTNPVWFARSGGWESARTSDFIDYVSAAVLVLDDVVDLWCIFNEPMALAIMGWVVGDWPPGVRRSLLRCWRVLRRVVRTHNDAYALMKRITGKPVGIAHSMLCYQPASGRLRDRMFTRLLDHFGNQWFLRKTRNDFIGVNYYMRERWRVSRLFPPKLARLDPERDVSDFGWEIYPEGLRQVLNSLQEYGLPVYVTENGVADAADVRRAGFIRDHIAAMHGAMEDGTDVRGYFHWSLLDNFEWAEGYSKRFGLIGVDFRTGKRTVRPSAGIYKRIARTGRV